MGLVELRTGVRDDTFQSVGISLGNPVEDFKGMVNAAILPVEDSGVNHADSAYIVNHDFISFEIFVTLRGRWAHSNCHSVRRCGKPCQIFRVGGQGRSFDQFKPAEIGE